ncbi:MAG TPA: hypothetical protein GXZ87_09680 [Bacteroidales bacterium]|nr:hypothetical protein [Bacteroidales bacterium]
MILILLHTVSNAFNLVQSGYQLAQNLKKEVGLMIYVEKESEVEAKKNEIESFFAKNGFENVKVIVRSGSAKNLAQDCEKIESSFLFIQWTEKQKRQLKAYLKYCRDLRIPYLFFKDEFSEINFEKVLLTVSFLIEDYEKTQFASAFGRFCGSDITVLQANDYGSKAARTVEKMKQIFDKFDYTYKVEKAKADSFKLDKESVQKAENENYDILILSASRDYGLDDIIFGPKELHLVRKSRVPILLVNPRGDLYTLCD